MKKVFILGLVVISLAAKAQLNVSLGPTAGFGHAWMSGDGNNKYKPSGNFGLQLIYSANEHLGAGMDLKYSIEGGKKEFNGGTYEARLNYLRIPLKGFYFFNDYGDRIRPKVSLGPSFGFLLGGKQTLGSTENEVKDDFKNFDIGIEATAGVHWRLVTNTWLTLDLNYYHGLADISESEASKNKNRNLGVNVGLVFGIAKHTDTK